MPFTTNNIEDITILDEYIDIDRENELLSIIDAQQWNHKLSRRVQHYGWKDNCKNKKDYFGPIPQWLNTTIESLEKIFEIKPNQVVINEYLPGQGVIAHTDCLHCFGPTIASLSLISPVQMDFSKPGKPLHPILLKHRSLCVLQGEARYEWKHGIAKRTRDSEFGLIRQRRVSLTFRNVL